MENVETKSSLIVKFCAFIGQGQDCGSQHKDIPKIKSNKMRMGEV